ncbi:MAG: efflux RND transporter periplasmic adaptor subunit [Candidatus Cyclobacteriaceae bacterium M3_2C_046]
MNQLLRYLLVGVLISTVSCGPNELDQKKAQLKKYKNEVLDLNNKIKDLEQEIAALDPQFAKANREATLITTTPVKVSEFEHFIEVSGSVESNKNVSLSSETGGSVEQITVEEGDQVRRGQVLVRLDDEVLRNTIKELETSLELAETVYEKRARLWEKKIGTEIQYLESKNAVESLKSKLATTRSQLDKSTIRAPFTGSIDKVFIKEGEMTQPGLPLLRIVSLEDMYIEADVSEAYIGQFDKGDMVVISFPSIDATYTSEITSVGRVLDRNNRTFSVEVALPNQKDFMIKPNMIAIMKLKDFEAEQAVIVPTNLIQIDNRGDYVYVVDKSDSIPTARKVKIERGVTYKDQTVVLSGLSGQEVLVDEGFREVAEGHIVQEVEPTI